MNSSDGGEITSEGVTGAPGGEPAAFARIRLDSEEQAWGGGEADSADMGAEELWLGWVQGLDQVTCVQICEQSGFIA